MIIIPAIDIKDGKVVRLTQGRYEETIYSNDPLSVAKAWKSEGARILHIVDLDAALTGSSNNLGIIKDIASKVDLPIQFGGGLRSREVIKDALDNNISKVVIGTKAIDEQFLKGILEEFKDKIVVSIDEYNCRFATHGWHKTAQLSAREMIERLQSYAVKTIVYTDIARDGTMLGPNIERIKDILIMSGISVIASGGVGSIKDILALNTLKPKPYGVIVGKALYERKFKFSEALEITKEEN